MEKEIKIIEERQPEDVFEVIACEHKMKDMCRSSDRIANRIATEIIPDIRAKCGILFEELPTRTT